MSQLRDPLTERQYLSAILLEPSVLEAGGVEPTHMSDPGCALALSAMQAIRARQEPVDSVSLLTELERRGWDRARAAGFVVPLTDTVPPSWRSVADRIRVMAEARAIAEASALGQVHASRLELDEARGVLAPVALGGGTREPPMLTPSDLMVAAISAWEEISKTREAEDRGEKADPSARYIALSFGTAKPVERAEAGEMVTVAGGTGVGKSSMAWTCMIDLDRRGIKSGLVCIEDSAAKAGSKVLGHFAKVDTSKMWEGRGASRQDWDAIQRACNQHLASDPLYRVIKTAGHIDEVITSMSRLVRVHGARVVFVDYIQAISGGGGKGLTRRDIIDLNLARIKVAATHLGCVLVLLSQLSRPEKGNPFREPHLSDLKESGTLENSSDAVVMLWILTDDKTDPAYGIVKGKQAKSRSVERGERWSMRRGHGQILTEIEWREPLPDDWRHGL